GNIQHEIRTSPTEILECCKNATSTADILVNKKEVNTINFAPSLHVNDTDKSLTHSANRNNNILQATESQSLGLENKWRSDDGSADRAPRIKLGSFFNEAVTHRVFDVNDSAEVKQDIVITNIVHLNAYYRCLASLSRATRYKKRYDKTIHSIQKKSVSLRTKSPYWSWLRHTLKDTKADKLFRAQLLDYIKDSVRITSVVPSPQGKFCGRRKSASKTRHAKRICYDLRDNAELLTVDEMLDADRSCKRKVPSRVRV
ncbi:uncharacterized protein LOC117113186, partial [Anneissia japonica]|uniref:uncharacterized protein LOC117113186 n=1 Tax=Anneissia japonica TaxID=1529436 RepID=UPI001425957C